MASLNTKETRCPTQDRQGPLGNPSELGTQAVAEKQGHPWHPSPAGGGHQPRQTHPQHPRPAPKSQGPRRRTRQLLRSREAHTHAGRKGVSCVFKVRSNYPIEMPVVASCENAVTKCVLAAWLYRHGKIVRVLESSRLLPFWRLVQIIIFIRGYAATSVTRVLTQTRAAHTGSQELNEAPCSSVLCGPPYTGPAHSAPHSRIPRNGSLIGQLSL